MEIVKKNILSIISGIIAVLAIVAWFWPIGGMFTTAQAALEHKTTDYNTLRTFRTASRRWPVNGYENDPPLPLKRFPNKQIIKEGENLRDAIHIQADKMLKATVEGDPAANLAGNVHTLLLPGIFPEPRERRFNFQSEYLAMVQGVLAAPATPTTPAIPATQSNLVKKLQAVIPPNDDEIRAAADKLWKEEYDPKIITVNGQAKNFEQLSQDWRKAAEKLPEQMRTERATKFKLYVDTNALTVSRTMAQSPNQSPKDEDLWYAQNMLWVQNDVADAIIRVNANAPNVMQSPIKQLLKLELADDASQYVQVAPSVAASAGVPAVPAPEALTGKAYTRTPTGRVCNPLYDVIQFTLQINVDARQVPTIISELERGKLITIYQADAATVDAQAAVDDGYIYGPGPVITLTLKGEELFMRAWTIKLMPENVKTMLGITAADVAAANAAPAQTPAAR